MRIFNNYLDLFAGIGGFNYGARLAGLSFNNEYYSEIDRRAIKVYEKHYRDSVNLGDITNIDYRELLRNNAGCWLITGGFPCQDISGMGKMEGLNGKKSGLWFSMFNAIRILRPKYAIVENVSAITRRGLSTILGNIAEIGYDAEWKDIRASDLGFQHQRERVWIVAYPYSRYKKRNAFLEKQIIHKNETWKNINRGPGRNPPGELRRKNDGISEELYRMGMLGNSIVPQISQMIFELIIKNEKRS